MLLEFASKKKNCKKGYPCGYSCINRRHNCIKKLKGQGRTYADWLKKQAKDVKGKIEKPDKPSDNTKSKTTKSNKAITAKEKEPTLHPLTIKQLEKNRDKWLAKAGLKAGSEYSNMHDMQHMMMHELGGFESSDLVNKKASQRFKNSPSLFEEGLIIAFQELAKDMTLDKKKIKAELTKSFKDVKRDIEGLPADKAVKQKTKEIIDKVVNNPQLEYYYNLNRKMVSSLKTDIAKQVFLNS